MITTSQREKIKQSKKFILKPKTIITYIQTLTMWKDYITQKIVIFDNET